MLVDVVRAHWTKSAAVVWLGCRARWNLVYYSNPYIKAAGPAAYTAIKAAGAAAYILHLVFVLMTIFLVVLAMILRIIRI